MNDSLDYKINVATQEMSSAAKHGDRESKIWWHGYRAALIDLKKEFDDVQK